MKYKTYDEYKDSNIRWIGEIPENWDINKLKFSLDKITDGSHASVEIIDEGYPYVTVTDLDETNEYVDIVNCKRISKEDYDFLVRNGCKPIIGDILFSQIGTIGLVVPVDDYDDYVLLSSVAILTISKNIDRRWLIHFLRSLVIKNQWQQLLAGGAVKRITLQHIANFTTVVPPLSEQQQIANYLDKKTAKIDETITKNKQLIELLEEKRIALINQVVTKGLNPDVPMKDSGIDIIGNIPETNKLVRLKFLCDIKTGDKDTINRNPDGKYPFYVRSPIVERIDTYSFDGEAVLMAGDGVGAGKVFHYATGKFDYHQRVYNFHNFKHVVPKFIYYYMSSLFSIEIEKGSAKSTVDSVRLPMLEDFLIAYPSINKQKQIIEYLDNETLKIDCIISKVKENINLLEEYKTSLIHHVVTGKIDVRGEEI